VTGAYMACTSGQGTRGATCLSRGKEGTVVPDPGQRVGRTREEGGRGEGSGEGEGRRG